MSRFEGHTPGPWAQDHRPGNDFMYRTEVFSQENPSYVIATIHWCPVDLGGRHTASAREANARLIAAAPDLLRQRDELADALREIAIAPCITELLGRGSCEDRCPGCRARAALAKLEAES